MQEKHIKRFYIGLSIVLMLLGLWMGYRETKVEKLANIDNLASYTSVPGGKDFDDKLAFAVKDAESAMFANISPRTSRVVSGKKIDAAPGVVIAAPSDHDPDYLYHWVRDSSNVMSSVAALYERADSQSAPAYVQAFADYISLTERLQKSSSPYGLGETRYNIDGSVDNSSWARPQLDGPALRSLAMMRFIAVHQRRSGQMAAPGGAPDQLGDRARSVVTRDLDYLVRHWDEPGYDVWESYTGDYYYTRLVALSAFEQGAALLREEGDLIRAVTYQVVAAQIREHLDSYWRPSQGFMSYSQGPLRDITGALQSAPGGGLDAGTVMAAVNALVSPGGFGIAFGDFKISLEDRRHTVLDSRLLATAYKLERIFADSFPINHKLRFGPGTAIGRHVGDHYYGGNAFFFLTAAYAEMHYRQASAIARLDHFVVDQDNYDYLALVARRMGVEPWAIGEDALAGKNGHVLIAGLRQRGDDFMWMMMSVTPYDGKLSEQFDKETGRPASASNLTWSYSSFISAALARPAAVAAEQSMH